MRSYPDLGDLALLSDRHTTALIDRRGSILWYPPTRFDADPFLAALLDVSRGGSWSFDMPDLKLRSRSYAGDTGILTCTYSSKGAQFTVQEFMPLKADTQGILRYFERSSLPRKLLLRLPSFRNPSTTVIDRHTVRIGSVCLASSHPITLGSLEIRVTISAGEAGFAFLGASRAVHNTQEAKEILNKTTKAWKKIAQRIHYEGKYADRVRASFRALRMLTYEPTGGVIAAATTSLPEIPGGTRNYDYRYVWLRDAGMIASALIRAGSDGQDAERFLGFVCSALEEHGLEPPRPMFSVDGRAVPQERYLDLEGYARSSPVRSGNGARIQLQLDGYGNVLLAAKLLYQKSAQESKLRPHWSVVQRVADYLALHWNEPDHGIWEEDAKHQYIASKVIVARGLESIADFVDDEKQRSRWMAAAQHIRAYITKHGRTAGGAYAVYPGAAVTDVSLALLPAWGYEDPHTHAMEQTLKLLQQHEENGLYRRTLVNDNAQKEGAFLAGTIWVAQYWIERGEIQKGKNILQRVLEHSTDLGFLSEEADPKTGTLLGNIPQTFTHAALIGAIV